MAWWLIGALSWVALAVPAALVLGRALRNGDDELSTPRNSLTRSRRPARLRAPVVRHPVRSEERVPMVPDSGVL